jgi:hypothetical protein
MATMRERTNMLMTFGVPKRLANRICEAPPRPAGRFVFKAADDQGEAEILIYDFIGYDWWTDTGITALAFRDQLQGLGDVKRLTVHLQSAVPVSGRHNRRDRWHGGQRGEPDRHGRRYGEGG